MAIFPPSVLAAMPDADLPELRTLVAAGESCSAEVARRWGRGRQFLNGYGPTEGTVCTSVGWCDSRQVRPHIGPPVPNVRAYVLDGYLQPAPIGAPGELYIGGAGLARGYLNRPGLTAERFVPDPFSSEPGARLYRTGDRCRWLPDGNLDFLGRIDHQVKVRGFRVELGEIEAVLGGHADVQQAAVVAREDAAGDLVLVAYAAPRDGKDLSVGSLRAYLQERLPHYMAPSLLLPIASLPLLPNGKIDRKALPAPDRSRPQLQQPYVAPTTREEEILAKIWCEVLGVERVGIHDEFFELGGASIKSLRIVAKASEAGLTPADGSLSPELLFEHTTIAKLAAILRLNAESPAPDHANG
jgi:acyl-CoA synthetase (AMP-forming)/AMP-acid ligase II